MLFLIAAGSSSEPFRHGENKDTNFVLSGVTEIREKIGRVCHWPSMQDEPTGSIHPSKKR